MAGAADFPVKPVLTLAILVHRVYPVKWILGWGPMKDQDLGSSHKPMSLCLQR